MFKRAQRDFPDIDFTSSVVIGDSLSDMAVGTTLGCLNILIAEEESKEKLCIEASTKGIRIDIVFSSLLEATNFLLKLRGLNNGS